MSFGKILQELVDSVPGSVGAVFADDEGEPVEHISSNGDSYHICFLGAHNGILLNTVKKLSAAAGTGDPKTLHVRTEKLDFFTAPVYDGYFIVLAVDTSIPSARANFAITRAVRSIREEMGY